MTTKGSEARPPMPGGPPNPEQVQAIAAAAAGERRKFPFPIGRPLALRAEDVDFSWVYSVAKPNRRTDDGIEIVTIDGPLEHKSGWWFDSYEEIVRRIEGAMTGECAQAQQVWKDFREAGYQSPANYQVPAMMPARAIVLDLNSPGGEAAGATAAHKKIRTLRAEHGIPIYAYANELACSAAYEIACSADEIWLPESGVVGSIGVIATAFDRTKQNDMVGLDIELITSGAFKADGHPDRKLDKGIRSRIQARVDELAQIFFQVVADARDATVDSIAELQAATFMGQSAVEVGIADGVAESWEEFLGLIAAKMGEQQQIMAADTAA